MIRNLLLAMRRAADHGPRSAEALEQIACAIKVSHIQSWLEYVTLLEPEDDCEFQAIVSAALYAGFTAGDVARSLRYENSTVIRWAEGSTCPSDPATRRRVKDGCVELITRRLANWVEAMHQRKDAIGAQRIDWQTQRDFETPVQAPMFDLHSASQRIESLLSAGPSSATH